MLKTHKKPLMENNQRQSTPVVKPCKIPPLSSYPVKYPTTTYITFENFKNAIDFHPKEKLPCKNTWYRDVKSTHIRNKRLLDLPFKSPKCCTNIYNVVLDRQKLKKLQKYGLTRPVRTITHGLEPEEVKICKSEQEPKEVETVFVPECIEVSDFSSDEEDDEDEYEVCQSGSVSECSGCSALGTGFMKSKWHKVPKKDITGLLHSEANELCKAKITEELTKHKLGRDFKLKLEKVF